VGRSGDLPRDLRSFQGADDTGCGVLHIDMDAFYASVELRDRPELVERPVIVAGGGNRGVVLSANYLARGYGVRAAMPAAHAQRLCPRAVFLPPTFAAYAEVSRGVLAIFREMTPLVEPLSLDEAFLDVSGALLRLRTTPALVGEQIRRKVAAEHRITCSVGVASTKFVAKLASGMAKPDGLLVIPADRVLEFLHPLPVSALWGVGKRTAERLAGLGLTTVADIAATPLAQLRRSLGNATAEHLATLASGADPRAVVPDVAEKSIGAEETFEVDQRDPAVLHRELLRLSERTAAGLRSKGLWARTISIKVRYTDFTTITRSRTLPVATDVTQEIFRTACQLFDEHAEPRAIRLIGVRVEQLGTAADGGEQLLLDAAEHGWRDADQAADQARSKFGHAAVRPASLLGRRPDRAGVTEPKPDQARQ
jgi:DNA polymerase-4